MEGAGCFLKISQVRRRAILKAWKPYGGMQNSPGNPKQNALWQAEQSEGSDASPSTGPAPVFGPGHHESTTAGSWVLGQSGSRKQCVTERVKRGWQGTQTENRGARSWGRERDSEAAEKGMCSEQSWKRSCSGPSHLKTEFSKQCVHVCLHI